MCNYHGNKLLLQLKKAYKNDHIMLVSLATQFILKIWDGLIKYAMLHQNLT
jgi:hypothetical protein